MDLNGDGHHDILSGSYSRQGGDMAGLFQVLYGRPDRTFRKAEVLQGQDGQPLIIPAAGESQLTEKICTRPFAVDWDGDSHLDLIVGNFSGTFYWFKGTGQGRFYPQPESIRSGNGTLRIQGPHSDPFVIDWDGDGDLDVLSGSGSGGVQWAPNSAGPGKLPVLESFRTLIPAQPAPGRQFIAESDLSGPTQSTRVWADDVNGDGKLDVLVGDSVRLASPANGLSPSDVAKKQAEWSAALTAARSAMMKADLDPKARQQAQAEYRKVYASRAEFITEESTGFVWLYARK